MPDAGSVRFHDAVLAGGCAIVSSPRTESVMTIGYHASHEFPPATCLGLALRAEQAGFEALMLGPFPPWTTAQGSPATAGMGRRAGGAERIDPGHGDLPMLRQHPALVAQAAATLEQLAPGRIWLALGTGEALNERITGQPWPAKRERQKALRDAAEVMRRLWAASRSTTTVASGCARHGHSRPALPAAAGGGRHRGNRTLDGAGPMA